MESQGLLTFSKNSTTGSYLRLVKSVHTLTSHIYKIHFTIILPAMCSMRSILFRFLTKISEPFTHFTSLLHLLPSLIFNGQSQWLSSWRWGYVATHLRDCRFKSCQGHGCLVFCKCFVLSGTGLCNRPIPHPDESYWLWYVKNLKNEVAQAHVGLLGIHMHPNTLFSNTLCLCSSFRVSYWVSHPYKQQTKLTLCKF